MLPRARMLMVVVALALGIAPAAGARQFGGGRGDKPQISVEFGYTGILWPERWMPVTVHLTCGASAFDGLLSVTYEQDSTQRAQIVRQIAGTPNKTVAVQVMVNLPPSCRRMNVALYDRARGLGSRPVEHLTFADTPARDELPMPLIAATGMRGGPVVIGVGEPRGPASAVTAITDRRTGETAVPETRVSAAVMAPARLPLSWAGLDGVLLAAVEGDAALEAEPRALAAVREWVTGGGRLVIFAGTGVEWRRWMPGGDVAGDGSRLPVELGAGGAVEGAVPEGLAGALVAIPANVAAERDQALQGFPETASPDWTGRPVPGGEGGPATRSQPGPTKAEEPRPEPAARMAYRAIRLTPAGRVAGWNVRWPVGEGSGEGLLAEGPVGFGWVTVVGFDPRRVSTVVSSTATRAVWTAILQNPLADWRVASTRPDPRKPNYAYSYGYSGAETGSMGVGPDVAMSGHAAVLEKLSGQVPAATGSVFPWIVGTMVVLALCLGPLDMMLLGRLRLRHRSWATALGWIGLAMLAAYGAPILGGESVTHVGRVSVVDAIVAREGAEGALDPPALAWRTSMTGVFAGSTTRLDFEGATQGSWWRGTSALAYFDYYGGRRSATGGALVRAVQQLPDLGALGSRAGSGEGGDPWGGVVVGAPGSGGNRFGEPPSYARLWTFRTFLDEARVSQPLRAAVEPMAIDATGEPTGGWRVRLSGLPAGASIRAAALRVGTDWFPAEFHEEAPGGAGAGGAGSAGSAMSALCTSRQSDGGAFGTAVSNPTVSYSRYGAPMPEARYRPGLALALAGPDRRNMAVSSMMGGAGSGKWAALHLEVEGVPADVRLRGVEGALSTHTVVYRLLVPLTRPPAPSGEPGTTEEGGSPPGRGP